MSSEDVEKRTSHEVAFLTATELARLEDDPVLEHRDIWGARVPKKDAELKRRRGVRGGLRETDDHTSWRAVRNAMHLKGEGGHD